MAQNKETKSTETPWFGIAIVASCCLVPLMPFIFTIGGGWISSLTDMETRKLFLLIPLLFFIALVFRRLYCLPGSGEQVAASESGAVKQKLRMLFWVGSVLVLWLLAVV